MRAPVLAAVAAAAVLLGACKDDQNITEPASLAGQPIMAARTTSAATAGDYQFKGFYPRSMRLKKGRDSIFYIVVSRWKQGTSIAWKTSNPKVATVSSKGRVTAVGAGKATITATIWGTSHNGEVTVIDDGTDDGTDASAPAIASLDLDPSSLSLVRGSQRRISVTAQDASKREVKDPELDWRSSNSRVATVSKSGTVTAVLPGTATITATAGKVKESVAVTVTQRTAPPPTSDDDSSPSGGSGSSGGSGGPTTDDGTPTTPPTGSLPGTGGTWTGGTGTLYTSYSSASPHWPQIRTMVTDFRVTWIADPGQRGAEYDWMASKFDGIMSGDATEYARRNPSLRHYVYGLNVTMIQPGQSGGDRLTTGYAGDMREWFRRNPQYRYENAFLHEAGSRRDSSSRIVGQVWGSWRWLPNPADPGFRAYQAERVLRMVEEGNSDGIFWDEHDSGTIGKLLAGRRLAEFSTQGAYEAALVELLDAERRVLASRGKKLLINTATYGRPFDVAMMRAAGGVHKERGNGPLNNNLPGAWNGIDNLLSEGITVEFVTALPYSDAKYLPGKGYTRGNSQTAWERAKLLELASYYMVVDPTRMDKLLVDFFSGNWSMPFEGQWFKAIEANVGRPTGQRSELEPVRDRQGQPTRIFGREFDRALVLIRPMNGWRATRYDDATAAVVPLPSGETWIPLRADGTLGSPVRSVTLRNSEATILIKKSRIGG